MRILVLTHRFPYPPTRGDCIRAWGEIEHLSRRHDVWLACIDRVRPWPVHLDHVRRHCREVFVAVRSNARSLLRGGLSLLQGRSVTEGYFHDPRLTEALHRWSWAVSFDAVLTFSSGMAPYAAGLRASRRVLDMNDVDSEKWLVYARRSLPPRSWLYRLEARRLAAAENRWVEQHDVTLLVNERERTKLETRDCEPEAGSTTFGRSAARLAVVRTGVNLAWYSGGERRRDIRTVIPEPVVGMVGSMWYPPNVRAVDWFGRNVWPLVAREIPRARWLIVGSRPARSVRRFAALPGVTVTGFVQDVRPYLRGMRVFACPVDGAIGVQTKLIEAMAAGRAAVVSPDAAGGIDYDGEPPFLIAERRDEFAAAVIRLLRDDALCHQLAARGRAVAASNYCVDTQARLIERWLSGEAGASPTTTDSCIPTAGGESAFVPQGRVDTAASAAHASRARAESPGRAPCGAPAAGRRGENVPV